MYWEVILTALAATVVVSALLRLRSISPAWDRFVNFLFVAYLIGSGVYLAAVNPISAWVIGVTTVVVGCIVVVHFANRGKAHTQR